MIDVTVILGVFFVALDKKSEFPCCFIEASSKIGKKLNIYKPSKERVRTCKDYVIGRDDVILELCDPCDYFASPLLMEKKQLN